MVFDIYEQNDLFKIANCARQSTLKDWLTLNRILYSFDSKGRIIAHVKAVEAGLGVPSHTAKPDKKVKLYLGE